WPATSGNGWMPPPWVANAASSRAAPAAPRFCCRAPPTALPITPLIATPISVSAVRANPLRRCTRPLAATRTTTLDRQLIDEVVATTQRGQLEHGVEQQFFEHRAQTACARATRQRGMRNPAQRLRRKIEPRSLHAEQPLILTNEGVLGLGQDVDQHAFVE